MLVIDSLLQTFKVQIHGKLQVIQSKFLTKLVTKARLLSGF